MSYTTPLRRTRLGASIVIAFVAFSTALAAQTPTIAKTRRARAVHASATTIETSPPAEQPAEERDFRFSRPIVRVGQDYTLQAGDAVREIQTVLGDATLNGHVEQDVVVVVGSVRMGSTAAVEGSVVVIGGSLTVDPGASIRRDVVVVGGSLNAPAGFAPEGQQIIVGTPAAGNALRAIVPWITYGLLWGRPIVASLDWIWIAVAVFFLVYFVLNAVFRNPVRACADTVLAKPLSAFLLGLLVLVLTVPALAILAATVIGIAVIPFLLCALLAAALIGKVGVIRAIGGAIVPESSPDSHIQSSRSFVIGFAVLTLAYMVPVIGLLTWALTGVLGMGAAAATFRGALRREHPPRPRPAAEVQPVDTIEPEPVAAPEPAAAGYAPAVAFNAATSAPMGSAPPPVVTPTVAGDLAIFPRATFLDRIAAFALDAILVAIAVQLLDLSRHDGWFPLLLLVYHIAFWAWRGTTLGGIIVGLRVIRVQGTDVRFVDALVRGLASIFSIAALGIGCLWMLQDAERQMWHDKIAGTLVVKVPRHMVLP